MAMADPSSRQFLHQRRRRRGWPTRKRCLESGFSTTSHPMDLAVPGPPYRHIRPSAQVKFFPLPFSANPIPLSPSDSCLSTLGTATNASSTTRAPPDPLVPVTQPPHPLLPDKAAPDALNPDNTPCVCWPTRQPPDPDPKETLCFTCMLEHINTGHYHIQSVDFTTLRLNRCCLFWIRFCCMQSKSAEPFLWLVGMDTEDMLCGVLLILSSISGLGPTARLYRSSRLKLEEGKISFHTQQSTE